MVNIHSFTVKVINGKKKKFESIIPTILIINTYTHTFIHIISL